MGNEEYENEHFGFTVKQLSLERLCIIAKIVDNVLPKVMEKLSKNEETLKLLHEEKPKVLNNIWASFEKSMRHITDFDAKTFSIPNGISALLDQEINSYSKEHEDDIDDELKKLKLEFLQNSAFLILLEMENSQYESIYSFINEEIKLQEQVQQECHLFDLQKCEKLIKQIAALQQ